MPTEAAVHTHPSIPCPICGFGAKDPQKWLEQQQMRTFMSGFTPEQFAVAIIQEYTGMDLPASESLVRRMADQILHPEHKIQGEDPGY